MAIVDVKDLQNYMSSIGLDTEQMQAAQDVLDGVQRELEEYLNRPLEPKLIQERILSTEDGVLQFSVTPVHKLISVKTQFGADIPIHQNMGLDATSPVVPPLQPDEFEQYAEQYGVDGQVDYIGDTFYSSSVLGYGGFGSPWSYPTLIPNEWYVAKYIGGYIGYNDHDLKLSIMRVAAREMARNHDDSVSIKAGVITDPNDSGTTASSFGWTQAELAKHDRKRRRVIV